MGQYNLHSIKFLEDKIIQKSSCKVQKNEYHVVSEFSRPSLGWVTYPGYAIPTAGTWTPPGHWPPNCMTAEIKPDENVNFQRKIFQAVKFKENIKKGII